MGKRFLARLEMTVLLVFVQAERRGFAPIGIMEDWNIGTMGSAE